MTPQNNSSQLPNGVTVYRWDSRQSPTLHHCQKWMEQKGWQPYRFDFSPGEYYPPHSHATPERRLVVTGLMRFGVDKLEIDLNPGDCLALEAGVVHWAQVLSSQNVESLCASEA